MTGCGTVASHWLQATPKHGFLSSLAPDPLAEKEAGRVRDGERESPTRDFRQPTQAYKYVVDNSANSAHDCH